MLATIRALRDAIVRGEDDATVLEGLIATASTSESAPPSETAAPTDVAPTRESAPPSETASPSDVAPTSESTAPERQWWDADEAAECAWNEARARGENGKQPDDALPLAFLCVRHGALRALCLLLDRGCGSVHDILSSGTFLLIMAVANKRVSIVQELLRRGADVNMRNPVGHTSLTCAVFSSGSLDVCRVLMDAGADVNARDSNGTTPLMFAASYGRAEIIRVLFAHGADLTVRCTKRHTALFYAIRNNHADAVSALLDCGACAHEHIFAAPSTNDAVFQNMPVTTAFPFAVSTCQPAVVEAFLAHDPTLLRPQQSDAVADPLSLAVIFNNVDMVRALLRLGANASALVLNHVPQLMFAVWRGDADKVQALLDHGAHADTHTVPFFEERMRPLDDNSDPVQVAMYTSVVSQLQQVGISEHDVPDMRVLNTMLQQSRCSGKEIEAKLSFRILAWFLPISSRFTPLHFAIRDQHVDVVHTLLAAGADVGAEIHDGLRALHLASDTNPSIIAKLVEFGANVHAVDSDGDTPLHVAALFGNAECAVALCNAGADTHARNDEGRTPVEVAVAHGHDNVVRAIDEWQQLQVR